MSDPGSVSYQAGSEGICIVDAIVQFFKGKQSRIHQRQLLESAQGKQGLRAVLPTYWLPRSRLSFLRVQGRDETELLLESLGFDLRSHLRYILHGESTKTPSLLTSQKVRV